MLRFKVNDKVIVLAGKDKGKSSVISKIIKKFNRVRKIYEFSLVLEGVNFLKKHTKPVPNKNKPGGIVKIEAPISFSNVALLNPVTGKKDKVFFKILSNGKKVRVLKSNGEVFSWVI